MSVAILAPPRVKLHRPMVPIFREELRVNKDDDEFGELIAKLRAALEDAPEGAVLTVEAWKETESPRNGKPKKR